VTRVHAPDWDAAVQALARAPEIVVACHVNPDGDAFGSLLAATLGLNQLGKATHTTWGDPVATVPMSYSFLPGVDAIVQPDAIEAADTVLALDCGAGDRLGLLEPIARKANAVINVDHHPGNDNFGTHNIVVTEASSTAELVHGLLLDLGVKLDLDIATCIYTGIVTDTGRFTYSNTSPDTLRLAADLLALGVPATRVAEEVYDSSPFAYLRLVGQTLERATLIEKDRFVYSWITQDDLEETGVGLDETDKLIDQIRVAREADVAAVFKEQRDGSYRVSLRSRGPVSVGAIARQNGGGGHELAAGFTAESVAAGVRTIRSALSELRNGRE
jgi:bifunctional oligoribonuclease and PAP phosphatase NrnA